MNAVTKRRLDALLSLHDFGAKSERRFNGATASDFNPWTAFDNEDPVRFVQQFLSQAGVEFLFNGALTFSRALPCAETPEQIDEYLDQGLLEFRDIEDCAILFSRRYGYPWKKAHIAPALRQVERLSRDKRRADVWRPLYVPLTTEEALAAKGEWGRVGTLLDADPGLTIPVFQHQIWQIKSKSLGLPRRGSSSDHRRIGGAQNVKGCWLGD